jgi:hypothetical protein
LATVTQSWANHLQQEHREPRSFLVSLQHVAREVEAWIDQHLASHARGARAPGQLLQPGFARV